MKTIALAGAHTALVTPFKNGVLDELAFTALIERQICGNILGIVPGGTTGESPTLSHEEHRRIIEIAVRVVHKKALVIAGTGSNATSEAVGLTIEAEKLGADAALVVAPYYNKPSSEGLYRHFKKIAEAVSIPIILYSIPSRCGIEIPISVVKRLACDCSNIIAIKEAGGEINRVHNLRASLPENFQILSGDDLLTLSFMSAGAVGVISVASNIIPAEIVALVESFQQGDFKKAEAYHAQYAELFRDLFIETNPVPIKTALAYQEICQPDVRLPLCEMSTENRKIFLETLRKTIKIS